MVSALYSLDANAWSEILQGNRSFTARFEMALQRAEILICPVVLYEVRRGLEHAQKKKHLVAFDELASQCIWRELNREIWLEMATLWADLRRKGISVEDADLAIGVHARHFAAAVVTHNVRDFRHLGIEIEDWLES